MIGEPEVPQRLDGLETERLLLRELQLSDAPFILELTNQPGWLANIGDRGIRTGEDAEGYIANACIASYEQNGFGLWLVAVKDSGEPVGICGLVKREVLDDPDLGFAFLDRFSGRGYATEAALATIAYLQRELGLRLIISVVKPHNTASARVLEKAGLLRAGSITLPGQGESWLFASNAEAKDR